MGEEEATTNPPPSPPLPGCDFCSEAAAVVYCQADSARLCLRCDRLVHAANSVSSRHHRALLCDACRAAPAAILCSSSSAHCGLLCSNCDFDAHLAGSSLHDRRPVEPFTACPSVLDLAAVLGVGFDEKPARAGEESTGDDGGWPFPEDMWVWEMTPVLSLQDLIVPTRQHNFKAMGMPPLTKKQNPACGKHRDEVIRQLNELIKSETDEGNDGGEHKQVVELRSIPPEHNFEEGKLSSDFDHDPACLVMPSSEVGDLGWNFSDFQDRNDSTVFSYEQLMGSSSVVNASFPDANTAHPNPSHGIQDDKDRSYPVIEEKLPSLPSQGGVELCPDRESVISRYKEKRKIRRYDKQIRYESRKARADTRMRIKGRFAKVNQAAADSRRG